MKKRKTTRSARDGRAKQTENNGPKANPKTPRKTSGGKPASMPRRTTERLRGKTARSRSSRVAG
jgi:hypothetical protein